MAKLEQYLKLSKDFDELYEGGFIGVGEKQIQLKPSEFGLLFNGRPCVAGWNNISPTLEIEVEGVKFITLI